ncbi:glycoside hydrolase superfamily [Globomyces pollinis-pini]|nr:glycoside hydrolase superfamily [Globomyces pollinis-pini]
MTRKYCRPWLLIPLFLVVLASSLLLYFLSSNKINLQPTSSSFLTTRNSSVPNNLLWPKPNSLTYGSSTLHVNPSMSFLLGPNNPDSKLLTSAINRIANYSFKTGCSNTSPILNQTVLNSITIHITSAENNVTVLSSSESYNLFIPQDGTAASLVADDVFGAIRGLESFSQLVSPITKVPYHLLPCTSETVNNPAFVPGFVIHSAPWNITDKPRFKHRGVLLDTSRNYYPVKTLLSILDIMSFAKMNVFHWHIIDSHSFPLQSVAVPHLSKGAYSPWQIYSKSDIDTIVAYALERGIRVIPEFDMPGHSFSWGIGDPSIVVCGNKQPWTAYCAQPPCGQLDISNSSTISMVNSFLTEQASWFSDPHIHLGHDEINLDCYKSDSKIQTYLQTKSITPIDMVRNFTKYIISHTTSLSKKAIFWEEVILEFNTPIDKSNLIQAWKGTQAVKTLIDKGYSVIASPADAWYLDCGRGGYITSGQTWCSYNSWTTMYKYNPTTDLPPQAHQSIIGGEVAMWSEMVDSGNVLSIIFPRAFAAAEALWGTYDKDWMEAVYRLDQFVDVVNKRGFVIGALWPQYCRNGGCSV